jgi:hypothetical protein
MFEKQESKEKLLSVHLLVLTLKSKISAKSPVRDEIFIA